uniref:ANK_REP_REGION domain-containing protein n=1 Tax=Macrostomum lignano TaxID=282301 RepID=A0A1I8FL27_9PLAT
MNCASLEDMNMQLHASVRDAQFRDISFRLLSLGANPNFYHPHKRNTPLHVELLLVYGASPTLCPDGRAGNELTDRFSLYLCGRQPTHQLGVVGRRSVALPAGQTGAMTGRRRRRPPAPPRRRRVRLATLPDRELCRDLYDELDRRDNNRIVQQRCRQATSAFGVLELFFLPLSPHLFGRQKLGRLSGREFGAILSDSLEEAARRCGLQPSEMLRQKKAATANPAN